MSRKKCIEAILQAHPPEEDGFTQDEAIRLLEATPARQLRKMARGEDEKPQTTTHAGA